MEAGSEAGRAPAVLDSGCSVRFKVTVVDAIGDVGGWDTAWQIC